MFDVQASPSLPLQIVDFNSDGFNDIILVSRDGIYGYAQVLDITVSIYICLAGPITAACKSLQIDLTRLRPVSYDSHRSLHVS